MYILNNGGDYDSYMRCKIRQYPNMPCRLSEFIINGIKADQDEFGDTADTQEDIAENRFCCGRKEFIPNYSRAESCKEKYGIDDEELEAICNKLEEVLFIGTCNKCK